jgi:integrase
MVDGKSTRIKPHDFCRTYARRSFGRDVDLVAIQQNLGHANLKTTLHYIGVLNVEKRRPPSAYDFDLASLESSFPLARSAPD